LGKSLNLKYIAVTIVINFIFILLYAKAKSKNITLSFDNKKIPAYLIISWAIFIFLFNSAFYFKEMYNIVPIEQFLFHMALPIGNANFSMVTQFLIKPVIDSLLMTIIGYYLLSVKIVVNNHFFYLNFQKMKKMFIGIAALLPVLGAVFLLFFIGLPQYIFVPNNEPSAFYGENYIDPNQAAITFPENKRNLIVIIAESLETGFLKKEYGGAFTEDLIPEITELAKNNINFSKNDGIGGAVQLYGTEWTIAGIVAYYSGVPLTVPFLNKTRLNDYGMLGNEFLPGASGLVDILSTEGYKSYFILGSEIEFGGRDKYFKTHKDTVIYDYHYFRDNNFIPPDYRVWWGIEDRKLYQFTKDILGNMSKDEPFFVTLLTADMHPATGYLDEKAERVFDSQYKNVLRDSSRQLSEFIEWLYKQDFYENTTIVILGDHLYQDSSFFPEQYRIQRLKLSSIYEQEVFIGNSAAVYNRYPINIFINSVLSPENTKNRLFSHFDMLPVLIESIGGDAGEGLALGRSLNTGGVSTLVETFGETVLNEHLRRRSTFYNSLWGVNY
jgi:phosphoglycerol transferase